MGAFNRSDVKYNAFFSGDYFWLALADNGPSAPPLVTVQ